MSQAGILGINTSGIILTLKGNSGNPVPPTGNNINVVGDGTTITVAGDPGTSTLTISAAGSVSSSFPTDSGTATPSGGALTIKAGISTINCGASVQFTGSGSTVELNLTSFGISHNTLLGLNCGQFLTTGRHNTGLGYGALNSSLSGLSGSYNCALGEQAGFDITTGTGNIAIGALSLEGGNPGNYNIAIGFEAATNYTIGEDSNIVIGNPGVSLDANTIRIGTTGTGSRLQNKCFIAGIDGVNVGSVATVVTEASDQLGTAVLTAGTGISITPGANTITIATTGSTNPVTTLHTQDGNDVTATAGVINLSGGSNLTTTGTAGPNTATISLTGITQHSLQVGGAANSLTQLGVASNGQLPIGSTGADPVLAAISSGNNITVTNGAGTISVAVTGTTNHALQLGNASGSLTSLGVASNGQIPIGSAGADPVLATLTAGTGISISNGAGSITVSATGTTTLTVTSVNHAASPYTVLSTDEFLAVNVSGGVVTILLPNAPTTGRVYYVKDSNGLAAMSNITVTTVGGVVNIDGATSFTLNTAFEAISVIFTGSAYEVF